MFKGLGQLGDMAKMMKAAQDMQERMAALQEALATMEVRGEAGAADDVGRLLLALPLPLPLPLTLTWL